MREGPPFPFQMQGSFHPTFHPARIGSVLPLSWVNLSLAMTMFILPLQFQMLANVIRLYGHMSDDYVRRDCDYHRCQEGRTRTTLTGWNAEQKPI